MAKELEKLEEIKHRVIYHADGHAVLGNEDVNFLISVAKSSLQRLEAIDNADPSEAIKCLETMYRLCTPQRTYHTLDKCNNIIKQALLSRQVNVDVNEALKSLDRMLGYASLDDYSLEEISDDYEIIKQTLLKMQEQKQYLKWEDLEFSGNTSIKVKMGDTQYFLSLSRHLEVNSVVLRDDNVITYLLLYEKDKQFFNDLHLERVED